MFIVVWVETARSFGYNTYKDTALTVFTLGFYLYYINYATDTAYIPNRDIMPKSGNGEWVSSILFAVVAATLVHTYFMQPFTIPTSSLEKTLLVGDYLFVSKFHYGARTPMTTVGTPMLHDKIPILNTKSYSSWPELPYFRLPGFQKISRNDIVVFSWPVDNYADIGPPPSGYLYKPIDKKSNYVKRCVGLPGDSLSIRDGFVYINGKKNELPDRAKLQFSYTVIADRVLIDQTKTRPNGSHIPLPFYAERYDISDITYYRKSSSAGQYLHAIHLTQESYEKLKNNSNILSIERNIFPENDKSSELFPLEANNGWSNDFYGSLYIPEKGKTVAINQESLPFYKRIIEVYEGSEMGTIQEIETNGNQVLLNGQAITEYTFKQDYYWMMGDNRHNSQDARSWGYVPWSHVVGKPVFVWFSLDRDKTGFLNKIRWDRVFTTVKGSGKPRSYLIHFLVGLALYIGLSKFLKKKKANKA